MKKIIFTMFAAAALMFGMTSCSNEDNPSTPSTDPQPTITDQDLIGLWWEEYEYSDVTETGEPFTSVVLAVRADEDHTGCIYLGVYNDKSDEPLAVYGGFEDAGFTWELLADGKILLGDPITGEKYALTRGNSSYGQDMTNVSSMKLAYTKGNVTATNGSTTETLSKASSEQAADIIKELDTKVQSNVNLGNGGKTPNGFDEDDIR